MKKLSLKIVLILVLVVAGIYAFRLGNPLPALSPVNKMEEATDDTMLETGDDVGESIDHVFVAEEEGQIALDLIESEVAVETQDFGEAGMFIKSVEGLASDESHYWAVYVNDEYAQVGVSQLELNKGDELKLVYEKIDPAQL